jgi:hypothetical protein
MLVGRFTDEWYRFFIKYGRVVSVTVVIDNGQLLRALAQLHEIDHVLCELPLDEDGVDPSDKSFDDKFAAWKMSLWQAIGFDRDRTWWLKRRAWKDLQVQALLRAEYQVSKVFCVYNTEEDQLNALNQLKSGLIPAALDISDKAPSEAFRGSNGTTSTRLY